jgi:7,8-dihydropterin-6-yl-methyl-4-(beta-D-ribofuranosyl)aminobenzene 5'-phosphate synthase
MEKIGQVDRLEITCLIENSPRYDSYLMGCFGLSLWLKVWSGSRRWTLLFDVGPVAEALIHNARLLRLDLATVDMIVLSHNHFDHTGALAGILPQIGHEVPIFCHPDIFRDSFVLKPEFMNYALVGENRKERLEDLGGYFVATRSPVEPLPGFLLSGEVPRCTPFEDTGGISCFTTNAQGDLVPDPLLDDCSAFINVKNRGLVVLSGCSHAGPINILKHALKITGVREIDGVLAGFHLLEAPEERVRLTLEALEKLKPGWIAPLHCTGLLPTARMADAFGERFREVHAGDVLTISGEQQQAGPLARGD